jgi:effector-binding domain-containing protein
MKLLKRLLVTFLSLCLVYIGLCFLGPKSFEAKNELSIAAPINMVFDQIIDLNTWAEWSPWLRQDSTMEVSYGDQMIGVGASYSWKSEESGNGSLEISDAKYPTNIQSKMRFDDWNGISYSFWDLSIDENNMTNLIWHLETDLPISFLVRGIMLLNGSQKKLEEGLQKGIIQLKQKIENKYASNPSVVQKMDMIDRTFVIQKDSVKFEQIEAFYKEHLGFLATAAMTKDVAMDGMPCGLFYSWNTASQISEMAAAIPVDEVFDINPGSFETMDGGHLLYVDHFGPYSQLKTAHQKLSGFIQENDLKLRMPIIEEYMNDPTLVNDSNEIHTRVYYYYLN